MFKMAFILHLYEAVMFEVQVWEGDSAAWYIENLQWKVNSIEAVTLDIVGTCIFTVEIQTSLFAGLFDRFSFKPWGILTIPLHSSLFFQVVGLNFSSATTPELLLKTFDHYCEYRRTPNGVVLAPVQLGKWLVLFCDEINLPDMDKYGTQRVISFIRQV